MTPVACEEATHEAVILDLMIYVQRVAQIKAGTVDYDELVSAGYEGMVRARNNYNSGKSAGKPFVVWAKQKSYWAIQDAVRLEDPIPRESRRRQRHGIFDPHDPVGYISLEEGWTGRDGERNAFEVPIEDPQDPFRDIAHILAMLPLILQRSFVRHWWLGKSMTEIAMDDGVTSSRISQLCTRAQKCISQALQDDDILLPWHKETGFAIGHLRRVLCLTQADCARQMGIELSVLKQIETWDMFVPDPPVRLALQIWARRHYVPMASLRTPYAKKVRKSHCKHGHLLSDENAYVFTGGRRVCRQCDRKRQRERYHRQKKQ